MHISTCTYVQVFVHRHLSSHASLGKAFSSRAVFLLIDKIDVDIELFASVRRAEVPVYTSTRVVHE